MELKDKIIVITGGSSGLGKALAHTFKKEGCKVIISSHNEKELQDVGRELNADFIKADVIKEDEVKNLGGEVIRRFGKIDIWVNNAGIWIPHAPIEELDISKVHQMIEVNLFGTIYGSRVALVQMKKQGYGIIINILSTSALEGRPGSAGYCASKYAANGFTKSLRLELKPVNIQVISVYPGGMKTNLFQGQKPLDYENYMEPSYVANCIIENLKKDSPEEELIIKKATGDS